MTCLVLYQSFASLDFELVSLSSRFRSPFVLMPGWPAQLAALIHRLASLNLRSLFALPAQLLFALRGSPPFLAFLYDSFL